MKKYLFVISLFSFLFGQEEYQFFLTSDENLKLVGDNYDIIKSELDKMLSDYKSKIDLENGKSFWNVCHPGNTRFQSSAFLQKNLDNVLIYVNKDYYEGGLEHLT